jgi:cell wall-associated NlpC family hydrolase
MIGIPYLWGGNSSKGMDSSGFTKLVYCLNGMEIPRGADQQAKIGVPAMGGPDLEAFEKGVLLFFGSAEKADQPAQVTHVALSLGQGRFIHADQDVRINSLAAGSYELGRFNRKTFLFARKILGTPPGQGFLPFNQIPYYQGHVEEESQTEDNQ